MFSARQSSQLFPTQLWTLQVEAEAAKKLNSDIIALLDARIGDRNFPATRMFQTGHDLHEHNAVKPLVAYIRDAVDGALDELSVQHDGYVVTGCWANVSAPGASHPRHCHPNNFLSGVYYVSSPPDADTIMFDDPRPHWMHMAPNVRDNRTDNSNSVTVTVPNGTLILFPSWLMHYVPPNRSAAHRISVAFNIMFERFAETISKPKWTGNI